MVVFAHGIVGRADLPIPGALFAAAAAFVLAVSFAALAAGWTRPRLERVRERPWLHLSPLADVLLGAIGIAVFAVCVYAGLAGTDIENDNLAPALVYVVFWVGVPVVSLVLGDVFRLLSPWRAVGRVACAIVLAHDRALALHGSARGAVRSQVNMLALMVGFTCLGLWLLSVSNS